MKNILCPVDFSEAALEGMEYAAQMARSLGGRLTLIHIVPSIWPEAVHMEGEVLGAEESISNKLDFLKEKIASEFSINCDWHLSHTVDTIEKAIGEKAASYDLIVMGTNGADDSYQYAFGSNTYHVISETKCPLLIVPEGCQYANIQKIVYVFDPEMNPVYLADQLGEAAAAFPSKVIVLHVLSDVVSEETDRQLEILQTTLKARGSAGFQWGFEHEFSTDPASALDQVLSDNEPALLTLSFHHRTLVERLFENDMVKALSGVARHPLLVIHR